VFGPWGRGWDDGRPAPPRSVTRPLSPWVKGGWGTTGRGGRTTLESSKVKISKGWGVCFMDSHSDGSCSISVRLLSLDVYGGDEAGAVAKAGPGIASWRGKWCREGSSSRPQFTLSDPFLLVSEFLESNSFRVESKLHGLLEAV
jgi:hypothetical protein